MYWLTQVLAESGLSRRCAEGHRTEEDQEPLCTLVKERNLCRGNHFPAGPWPVPLPGSNNEVSLCVFVSLLHVGVGERVGTWQCLH